MLTPEDLQYASVARPMRLGRYDVIGTIGSGGMGAVFDAVDREHGGRVALKTLHRLSAEGILRFKNEFRAVADVSHPNLVPVYELGCHDGLWFFTMERITGGDFLGSLREPSRPRPLPPTIREDAPRSDEPAPPASARTVAPSPPRDIDAVRAAFRQLVEACEPSIGHGSSTSTSSRATSSSNAADASCSSISGSCAAPMRGSTAR